LLPCEHWSLSALVLAVAFVCNTWVEAAEQKPVKIGVVTFLSGPAAGPFGVPARNGAQAVVEALNAGGVPAPYATKGFGGASIEISFIDEAGGTTKQVSEYRNLVQRQDVDMVIGYISSEDCLAIAPVAEESKKLTILFDCGTPRIFEDATYHYVFRTGAHATMDAVSAALYVLEMKPGIKKFAGINQNYAWGQDSWNAFEASMRAIKPDVEVTTSQMPKFLAGQYGAEISALLASNSDLIHSSLWGGDLEAFLIQAVPRDLFKKSTLMLIVGEHIMFRMGSEIPDGTILAARGPHGVLAPDTGLNRWLRKLYQDRFNEPPTYAAYKIVQAFLGVKTAYEKALAANGGGAPAQEQTIAALEHLSWEGPSGRVKMALGQGHQAIQATAVGVVQHSDGVIKLVNVKDYPAEKVNPPEGVKSLDWIKSGFEAK
jgi:branched-chain amino acid transport system substrate-binding protein